jgi:hypothetical protein
MTDKTENNDQNMPYYNETDTPKNVEAWVTDATLTVFNAPTEVVEFTLHLADGSEVKIPCTAIKQHPLGGDGSALVAAALHHLIQRVDALEATKD